VAVVVALKMILLATELPVQTAQFALSGELVVRSRQQTPLIKHKIA
jgi:hypothetical protein